MACKMLVRRSSSTGGHILFVCTIHTAFGGSGEKRSKKKTTIQDRVIFKEEVAENFFFLLLSYVISVYCITFLFCFLSTLLVLALRIL